MSPTVSIKPMHPAYLEAIPGKLYSIPEHPRAHVHDSTTAPSHPKYPGLAVDRNRPMDLIPARLKRPKKLSGSLGASSAFRSHQSLGSPTSCHLGSRPPEPADWSPCHLQVQRPAPTKRLGNRARPNVMVASFPDEVLEVILESLKEMHLGRESDSCATCWMRDLCSLSLSCRKWYMVARRALYGHILLVGPDSLALGKKLKVAQGGRMMLLRRTLRSDPGLAGLVRSLKVPQPESLGSASDSRGTLEQYEDSVAALVMACPNLERLSGPIFAYNHSFKRLFHALSTRSNLKDMSWLVEPPEDQKYPGGPSRCDSRRHHEMAFIEHHRNWTMLSSLSIHCVRDTTLTPHTLLAGALAVLPSLQHLHLSNLGANAFNDTNLLSLPRLKTLTLSNISGISSNGLSSFATRPNSQPLARLHLRHTPLTSLPALARLFSNLHSLVAFSLVQHFPPSMPDTDSFALWMMPYLASATVTKMHWDMTSHALRVSTSDDILARSIEAGGFPALRTLRAPNDPEGIFQGLCRPVERIDLPDDRLRSLATAYGGSHSAPSSPTKHLFKSPTTRSLPSMTSSHTRAPPCTSLLAARLAAQCRIERARDTHRFRVKVEDEDGSVVDAFGLGGYMGAVGSNIDYCLLPDDGSTDDRGGLVDVADVYGDAGESLAGGRGGCDGGWKWKGGAVADRRERERWWHTERGRWTSIRLD